MRQISNHVFCEDFIADLKLETRLMPNPYYDYPYLIIKNFLSPSTCNDIARYTSEASEVELAKVKAREMNAVIKPKLDKSIRKTMQHILPDIFKNAYALSFKTHQTIIEEYFNLALTTSTDVQTLEYTKGSFYIKHADDSNELIDDEGQTAGFIQVAPQRKLSTVLFATSYEKQNKSGMSFKGGELLFNYLSDGEGKAVRFFPEAGDMIVFPSNPIYSHEVVPVESGYRLTLVQWHDAIMN